MVSDLRHYITIHQNKRYVFLDLIGWVESKNEEYVFDVNIGKNTDRYMDEFCKTQTRLIATFCKNYLPSNQSEIYDVANKLKVFADYYFANNNSYASDVFQMIIFIYQSYVETFSHPCYAYRNCGGAITHCYRMAQMPQEAINFYNELISEYGALCTETKQILTSVSAAYLDINDEKTAIEFFNKAVEKNDGNPDDELLNLSERFKSECCVDVLAEYNRRCT